MPDRVFWTCSTDENLYYIGVWFTGISNFEKHVSRRDELLKQTINNPSYRLPVDCPCSF